MRESSTCEEGGEGGRQKGEGRSRKAKGGGFLLLMAESHLGGGANAGM